MNKETSIQNLIRIALSAKGCIVLRSNVGLFYTPDGRMIRIGEKGQSDLHGHRPSDGKAFYLETKTPIGKLTSDQRQFLRAMKATGAIAGTARSPEEAVDLVLGGVDGRI